MAGFRVGVDIGGTFTDIVFLDADGGVHTRKVSSSVDDYARAIVEGMREGNGPLFAGGMASQLEMTTIVVPPAPGLFSSFGLLYADVEHHYVRTYRRRTQQLDLPTLNGMLHRMEAEALAQLGHEGFTGTRARVRRLADLRYHGQSFELTVPVPTGDLGRETIAALEDAFGREHERVYGHRAGPAEPVELATLRVIGQGIPERPRVPDRVVTDRDGGAPSGMAGPGCVRHVYFGPDRTAGPCIVEEYDATCVIPPGARASLDRFGNIVMELRS